MARQTPRTVSRRRPAARERKLAPRITAQPASGARARAPRAERPRVVRPKRLAELGPAPAPASPLLGESPELMGAELRAALELAPATKSGGVWASASEAAPRSALPIRANASPASDARLRAFQSNLLSLISHELRTPLMGVINALSGLESESPQPSEWLAMATRNVRRLERNLNSLLDLSALESGTFHPRLREVELARVVQSRIEAGARSTPQGGAIGVELRALRGGQPLPPVLGDAQKLGRAIDLVLDVIAQRLLGGAPRIEVSVSQLERTSIGRAQVIAFEFELAAAAAPAWLDAWRLASAGFQAGVVSPASAFGGALASEETFLTRTEEGLGSELLLIHQILKIHGGAFEHEARTRGQRPAGSVLRLVLPLLSAEAGLGAVVGSRVALAQLEVSSIALALIAVPEGSDVEAFRQGVQRGLFRSSDSVYALPERRQLALVMDDCKAEDAPGLMQRVGKGLNTQLRYGVAACPADGFEVEQLLRLAQARLAQHRP